MSQLRARVERSDVTTQLAISEFFGPTFQGEGPLVGMRTHFLRLSGCPVGCVWCDTPYTWRFSEKQDHVLPRVYGREEVHLISIEELYQRLVDEWFLGMNSLVITGGEPMAQQENLYRVLLRFHTEFPIFLALETSGVVPPTPQFFNLLDSIVISPKLTSSGVPEARREVDERWFIDLTRTYFKFVVTSPEDMEEIDDFVGLHAVQADKVFLMPEAVTREQLRLKLPSVARLALKHGYNLSTRLHVELYDTKRGV